jgi:hypothetical protein
MASREFAGTQKRELTGTKIFKTNDPQQTGDHVHQFLADKLFKRHLCWANKAWSSKKPHVFNHKHPGTRRMVNKNYSLRKNLPKMKFKKFGESPKGTNNGSAPGFWPK